MSRKNSQKSLVIRKGRFLGSHRKPKIGAGLILRYLFSGTGDKIYYLGLIVERWVKNAFRYIRHGLKRAIAACAKGLLKALAFIGHGLAGIGNDFARPFQKMRRSFKSLAIVIKSTEGRSGRYTLERVRVFFKYGWLWNKHLIARLLNYLMPIAALSVCLVTISSMVRLNYALEVVYNGQVVGYINNENVYEAARRLIQNKMINSGDAELWNGDVSMKMTIVNRDQVVTENVLQTNLVSASGGIIVEATGIYVGGRFYGATAAPDLVKDALEGLLESYNEKAAWMNAAKRDSEVKVKFAREVEYKSGIFSSDDLVRYETLLETLTSPYDIDKILYYAKTGEVVSEIAIKNGIPLTQLQRLNPDLPSDDMTLGDDITLVVAENEPLLRVKMFSQTTEMKEVQCDTTLIKDPSLSSTSYFVLRPGKNGKKIVTTETEYNTDGRVVSQMTVGEEVIEQPENRETLVGTAGGSGGAGNSMLLWPVSRWICISRGWRMNIPGQQDHYGVDIACAPGSSVLAANPGKVVLSGWYGELGYCVIIQHDNNMYTEYGHNTQVLRNVGDWVGRGDIIALSGSTGKSTGPHLHFGVSYGYPSYATFINPEPLLGYPDHGIFERLRP